MCKICMARYSIVLIIHFQTPVLSSTEFTVRKLNTNKEPCILIRLKLKTNTDRGSGVIYVI